MPFGLILLAAASASTNMSVIGPSGQPFMKTPAWEVIEQLNLQHSAQLQSLHDDGLAIQRADGGTLTPEHYAQLQARLDRIQASYRLNIERADPWAVDSMGMRRTR